MPKGVYDRAASKISAGVCGRCAVSDTLHPKPPTTDIWICPDEVIRSIVTIFYYTRIILLWERLAND